MRRLRIQHRVAGLRKDSRGVAALELALVSPVLFLLLLGSVDIFQIVAARLDLEQAAQRTTDFSLAVRPRSSDGTYLRNEAATAAGVPTANVTVDIFLECEGVRQTSFSTECPSGQTRARFVSVSIVRHVQPMFDWAGLAGFFGSQILPDTVTVAGDSIVRFQ